VVAARRPPHHRQGHDVLVCPSCCGPLIKATAAASHADSCGCQLSDIRQFRHGADLAAADAVRVNLRLSRRYLRRCRCRPEGRIPGIRADKPASGFLAGSIKKYETLPKLVETFGAALDGDGKYVISISDLPQGNRFSIKFGDFKIFAIFIDDTSV
jgi:hypothetical protein